MRNRIKEKSSKSNVEIYGILCEILNNNLEDKVINICQDAGIKIGHMDIESYHWFPLSRNNAGDTKCVIVKEDMLQLKKIKSSSSKVFISNSLCPYYCYCWGKCKDLQQKGIFNQVSCLEAVVAIKFSRNGPLLKICHENNVKIYQGDGNASDGEWIKALLRLKVYSQQVFWWGLVPLINQLIS